MQVLHINSNYSTSALHQIMVENLNKVGISSKVFIPTYDKNKSIIDCRDYEILSQCFDKWDRVFFFKKQKKIENALLEVYDIAQFDIIHAYTLFTDGYTAMDLSEKYNIPYVVAIRNTDVNIFFKKLFHLHSTGVKILKKAKAVFFLSPAYKNTIINKYVPKSIRNEILKKSYIIPNGIDDFWHNNIQSKNLSKTAERIKRTKELRCLFVGNIDNNKNIELTLKALRLLNEEGWKCSLTAIGRIINDKVFKRLCRYSFFKYEGMKNKEQLINNYRNADIFVMPSHTETFGLVYAEALSQSLPVIYTKGQGFDEQFIDGEVGYSVNDNDYYELKDRIKQIVDDMKIKYKDLPKKIEKYKWKNIALEYEKIYSQI